MELKKGLNGKWKDTIILILIALVLAIAVWQVFGGDSKTQEGVISTSELSKSEEEIKLMGFLSQMQGVGEVDVMIYQTDEGEKSVVIVCDGAEDIQVQMHIREATATALGTTQQAIKIYLKKD